MSRPDVSVKEYALYLEERRHTRELTKLMSEILEERDKLENSYLGSVQEIAYLQDKVTRLQEENQMYENFLSAINVSTEAIAHYAETGELP